MAESNVQRDIMEYLKKGCIPHDRLNSGIAKLKYGGIIRLCKEGTSDTQFKMFGFHVFCEIKKSEKHVIRWQNIEKRRKMGKISMSYETEYSQQNFRDEWVGGNHVYILVGSLDQFITELGNLKKLREKKDLEIEQKFKEKYNIK